MKSIKGPGFFAPGCANLNFSLLLGFFLSDCSGTEQFYIWPVLSFYLPPIPEDRKILWEWLGLESMSNESD